MKPLLLFRRFFAVVLLLAVSTLSWAYDFEVDGIYYDINADDVSVTVTYKTTSYNSYSGSVVIPATVTYDDKEYSVTAIGENAFRKCTELTSLTIPDGLTTIAKSAFSGCWTLASITIPNSVTTIADYAFYDCRGIQTATIGSGVTSIGQYAFTYWNSITDVYCNAKQVPETHSDAFAGGNIANAKLHVPESAASAYKSTAPWSGFGTIVSPTFDFVSDGIYYLINEDGESVSVGRDASKINSYSGNIVIPSVVTNAGVDYSVTGIGMRAFSGCTGMTSVTIPNSVTSIGEEAFFNCTGLTSVTIPGSVTSINESAFSYCTHLASVTISQGVASIGRHAFSYCDGLKSAIIPEGVTIIGEFAFYDCTSLTSVKIPSSVRKIESGTFGACSSLQEVICLAEKLPAIELTAFGTTDIASATLYVPESILYAYQVVEPWNGFGTIKALMYDFEKDGIYYIINEDGESVSVTYRATDYNSYSGSVVIPVAVTYDGKEYSVTAIGENAFRKCTELTSLTIPNGLTTIAKSAFSGCWTLASITIPNSVTTIADYAFYDCRGIQTATIGSGVTSIGQYAFTYWNSITDVYCNAKQVPETHSDAFAGGNIANAKLHVPESAASAYKSTAPWSGFGSFYSVTYDFKKDGVYYKYNEDGNSVSVTYDNATAYNTYSGSVVIPATVTYDGKEYSVAVIGENAFRKCTELTSLTIPNGLTTIAKSAFSGCWTLASITIPNSVTTIADYAFYDCRGIQTATIGSGVTSIGQYAFTYWNAITEVWCLADQLPTTHSDAFAGGNIANAVLYVPESLVDAYTETAPWSGFGTINRTPYDFEVDGIYYGKYSDDSSVFVTYRTKDGNSYTGSVAIPSTVTYKGKQYDVYYIDEFTFYNCTGLTSVSIPDGVRGIGQYAFEDCTGLETVIIPNSVNNIEKGAFARCSSLKKVYCMAKELPHTGSVVFSAASISSATLYVPESAYNAYLTTAPWSGFGTIATMPYDFEADGIYYKINEDETSVSVTYRTTDYNSYSGRVIIPSAVTYDGKEYSVTAIGQNAFRNCSDLTNVTIPNGVTSIGKEAFNYCSKLQTLTIPNSVTNIGDFAFRSTGLQLVSIGYGLTNVGSRAFLYCSDLKYVLCRAEQVPATNMYAFQGVDLANAYLCVPESAVNEYSTYAPWSEFGMIQALQHDFDFETDGIYYKINEDGVSVSVTRYHTCGYSGSIVIPSAVSYDGNKYKVTSIARSAFNACPDLTSVTIPEGVTTIGEYAFGDSGLTSVTISNSVTSIGKYAFLRCGQLQSVTCMAEQVPETSADAFYSVKIASSKLYVPASAVDVYKATAPWSGFGTIIGVEPAYILGDANNSGEVEIGDVTAVLTLMADPEAVGNYNRKAADANKTGEIEIGDVTTILTIMATGGK